MRWYIAVLQNYAELNGRARRKEFWMFGLFTFIFSLVAVALDFILGTVLWNRVYVIYNMYSLFVLIPSIAVGVRRLQDTGRHGLNLLWSMTIVGNIYLIIVCAIRGTRGENKYGPDPIIE